EDEMLIYTSIDNTQNMLQYLQNNGYNKVEGGLEWVPKNTIKLNERDGKKIDSLFEKLDEHDDVQEIYSNIE
ncbi:MAG: YebC/PmpR family DNA-binding transcriptional regulator, partial [Candidatus Spechtbacterales bacterium]|nr:YebC/PmpR family DNA-binding transcriptional regulator [Candidatus Spechtbacterales bacterium]